MEIQIHDFQAQILRTLLFNPNARFRDLNTVDVTNDHFSFHINKLLKDGLISKENSRYVLTISGKEFANRLDTDSLKIERQAKVAIALHAVRRSCGQKEFLIHHRLKEPFYGWYGSHSGKIHWGETPLAAAQREFLEETGLTGNFTHKGIVHYLHYYKDGKLLEDKYFWVYLIENVSGNLKHRVEEGENIWMTEKDFRSLKNTFATFEEMTEVLDSKDTVYLERSRIVDEY